MRAFSKMNKIDIRETIKFFYMKENTLCKKSRLNTIERSSVSLLTVNFSIAKFKRCRTYKNTEARFVGWESFSRLVYYLMKQKCIYVRILNGCLQLFKMKSNGFKVTFHNYGRYSRPDQIHQTRILMNQTLWIVPVEHKYGTVG